MRFCCTQSTLETTFRCVSNLSLACIASHIHTHTLARPHASSLPGRARCGRQHRLATAGQCPATPIIVIIIIRARLASGLPARSEAGNGQPSRCLDVCDACVAHTSTIPFVVISHTGRNVANSELPLRIVGVHTRSLSLTSLPLPLFTF
jgi:hypothetical protein